MLSRNATAALFCKVFLHNVLGYIGGSASFQDVISNDTATLFCAATPNPDASQV